MTAEEYRNYLEQDFSDVDINEMTDLRMIKADRNKSLQERRDIFLNKVGNPYLVRIGNMKVKVRFANNGISMVIITVIAVTMEFHKICKKSFYIITAGRSVDLT